MFRLIITSLLFTVVASCSSSVFAQGEFLEGKASGLGVAASLGGGNDITVGGLTMGYSFSSILDLSLGAGLAFHGDQSEKAISPRATIWLFRENRVPEVKVTLGISAMGTFLAESSDKEWSILGILAKRIYTDQGNYFQPWIGGGPGGADGYYGSDNGWLAGGGLDLVFRTGDHSHLFFSPYYLRSTQDISTGGISAGMVFDVGYESSGEGN